MDIGWEGRCNCNLTQYLTLRMGVFSLVTLSVMENKDLIYLFYFLPV